MSLLEIDYMERVRRQEIVDRRRVFFSRYGRWTPLSDQDLSAEYDADLRVAHDKFLAQVDVGDIGYVSPRLRARLEEGAICDLVAGIRERRVSDHVTNRLGFLETNQGRVYWAITKPGSISDLWRALVTLEPFKLALWSADDVPSPRRPISPGPKPQP